MLSPLCHISPQGRVLGAAVLTSPASHKPVFVSVGSGLNLDTAISLVTKLSSHNPVTSRDANETSTREPLHS